MHQSVQLNSTLAEGRTKTVEYFVEMCQYIGLFETNPRNEAFAEDSTELNLVSFYDFWKIGKTLLENHTLEWSLLNRKSVFTVKIAESQANGSEKNVFEKEN